MPLPTPLASGVSAAFTIDLADPEGDHRLPVTILDRTGLVESVETFIREDMFEGVANAPAPDEGLEYVFETGACASNATVTFEEADILDAGHSTYRLATVVGPDRPGGCTLQGVIRPLRLKLAKPIRSARVVAMPLATSSYELMFDRFATKYPTEFELLDTTGLVTGLAHPARLGDHGGLTDAVPPDTGLLYWPAPSTCTYRIAMLFEEAGQDTYQLHVWFDTNWNGFDCAGDSMGRWVRIEVSAPVPASKVTEIIEPEP